MSKFTRSFYNEIFLIIDNPKSGVIWGEIFVYRSGRDAIVPGADDTSMLNINVGASIVESWTYWA